MRKSLIIFVLAATCSGAFAFDKKVANAQSPKASAVSVPHVNLANGTISPIGHEAKYNVYPVPADDLDDLRYIVNGDIYSPQLIRKAIPPIDPKDVNKNGYTCELLCVNSKRQVVGWNPLVKN